MKIRLATITSKDVRKLASITNPNKQAYCALYNYEYVTKADAFAFKQKECGWHALAFERFYFFSSVLATCDVLLACGADVLITNPNIKLESFTDRKPFLITKDAIGFQTDVMILRNHPRVFQLLNKLFDARTTHCKAPYLDQTALEDFAAEYSDVIEILPQRAINSFDYANMVRWHGVNENYKLGRDVFGNDGQWKSDDFIFHAAGYTFREKRKLLRKYADRVTWPNPYNIPRVVHA